MRHIIITLTTTLLVFVATIVATNIYISNGAETAAEYGINQELDHFCSDLENYILITESSAYNFLGFAFRDLSPEDSIPMTIDSKQTSDFMTNVYNYLEKFIQMNPYYQSAMFVVDSTICRKYYGMKQVFAPMINQGDSVHYNISTRHDFMKSANYKRLKETRKAFWSVPTTESAVSGKLMNMYVPLTIDNQHFFGAFIVSINVKMLDGILRKHLPYGEEHSQIMLIDERGNTFASCPSVLKTDADGKKYYTYERKTDYATWTIRTVCEEDAIYHYSDQFEWVVFLTSFLGMILMFICCFVVFKQISKNMRQKAAAESELKMAADLQMSILKPAHHHACGIHIDTYLHPAIQAGGDLYDYVSAYDKTLIIIGDVSGKGMPAALFMTQVVSLFRNVVRYTQSPDKIMAEINDSLAENNPTLTFCTAIIVCIPTPTSASTTISETVPITVCNAGHTRPILGNQFVTLHSNMPLGVMPGYQYQPDTFQATGHAPLLLYTDGVTEAQNPSGQFYEEPRLLASIAHGCTVAAVLTSLKEFVNHAPQSDDITIVTISV